MTEPGLDESYPLSVLASAPVGATRMRARGAAPVTGSGGQAEGNRLSAGPAGYISAVRAADRPRNLAELAARVDLSDLAPWPVGASVPMGERGKRAHWTGSEWRGGESPGYAAPAPKAPPALPPFPDHAGTQFPGSDTPEDLHR